MTSTDLNDLMIWETTDPGKPVCIADRKDGGFSVSLYLDSEGGVQGVLVYDEADLVSATGLIPAEVLEEELSYA